MVHQIPLSPEARADNPERDKSRSDGTHEAAPDVAYLRTVFVNVVFVGDPWAGDRGWVLIDAGIAGSVGTIRSAAEKRFGQGARPRAIVLTHGHFDHVGALETLAEEWNAPIYAHPLERPYLDGSASYPPPDPSVGGGLMARLSPLYPRSPVDVSRRLQLLPEDGSVLPMPGWRAVHSPGHSPGHVSFFREGDRTLIVGDAFVTTDQESAYAALTQKAEMHGPPQYFTPDWESAEASVKRLAALEPELVVPGHGRAMQGPAMRSALHRLAAQFRTVAVPEHGRYVRNQMKPGRDNAHV